MKKTALMTLIAIDFLVMQRPLTLERRRMPLQHCRHQCRQQIVTALQTEWRCCVYRHRRASKSSHGENSHLRRGQYWQVRKPATENTLPFDSERRQVEINASGRHLNEREGATVALIILPGTNDRPPMTLANVPAHFDAADRCARSVEADGSLLSLSGREDNLVTIKTWR